LSRYEYGIFPVKWDSRNKEANGRWPAGEASKEDGKYFDMARGADKSSNQDSRMKNESQTRFMKLVCRSGRPRKVETKLWRHAEGLPTSTNVNRLRKFTRRQNEWRAWPSKCLSLLGEFSITRCEIFSVKRMEMCMKLPMAHLVSSFLASMRLASIVFI